MDEGLETVGPRARTKAEMRDIFVQSILRSARYWAGVKDQTIEDKLLGLGFSFLVMLDGGLCGFPPLALVPVPHEDDEEFHRGEGNNWWPTPYGVERELVESFGLHEGHQLHEIYSGAKGAPPILTQHQQGAIVDRYREAEAAIHDRRPLDEDHETIAAALKDIPKLLAWATLGAEAPKQEVPPTKLEPPTVTRVTDNCSIAVVASKYGKVTYKAAMSSTGTNLERVFEREGRQSMDSVFVKPAVYDWLMGILMEAKTIPPFVEPGFLIWWTTQAEAEVIGNEYGDGLVEGIPEYIRSEWASRRGRPGRGRLWIARELTEAGMPDEIDLPDSGPTGITKFLDAGSAAGIAIWDRDAMQLGNLLNMTRA